MRGSGSALCGSKPMLMVSMTPVFTRRRYSSDFWLVFSGGNSMCTMILSPARKTRVAPIGASVSC